MHATTSTTQPRTLFSRIPGLRLIRLSAGVQRAMLVTGIVICAVFLLTAIFAPWLAPYGFDQLRDGALRFTPQQPPTAAHPFGTSVTGYDVLSRVIWGTRTALLVLVMGTVFALVIGVLLGLLAGYLGGWVDRILTIIADAIYSFPSLLLAIVVSVALTGGQSNLWGGVSAASVAISVVYIPQYLRVTRAAVSTLKSEPFVEASAVVGTSTWRILMKHLLPNAIRLIPFIVTLNAADAIMTLAGLGFLGMGIEPTAAAEWGFDLNQASGDVSDGIWWSAVFPGLAIVVVVLGLSFLGEALNDLADPRHRVRARKKTAPPAPALVPISPAEARAEELIPEEELL